MKNIMIKIALACLGVTFLVVEYFAIIKSHSALLMFGLFLTLFVLSCVLYDIYKDEIDALTDVLEEPVEFFDSGRKEKQ